MSQPRARLASSLLFLAVVLSAVSPASAKEGFGRFTKKATPLTRVTPPAVFLMGNRFNIKSGAQDSGQNALAQRLRSQLESELISRDSRLTVDRERPEVVVEVDILQNDLGERWEDREVLQRYQAGTDEKGKAVYKTRTVTVKYKVLTYSFSASFKVLDATRGGSLAADTVPHNFKGSFAEGEGAPETFTLESSAVNVVVDRIARRITPSREVINVLLPKGSLENLVNLADAGQWSRYLEAMETMPAFPAVNDESYRQYALGVANEAMGYAADTAEMTLKYLEQASLYYNKAIGTNPAEKYFMKSYDSLFSEKTAPPPLDRVKESIVNYRRILDFRNNYEAHLQAQTQEAQGAKGAGGSQAMDNGAVIRMVRAGLEKDIILKAISDSPKPVFDTTPQGLIELAEAKVDKAIILRIQEVVKKAGTPKAATTSKKSGSKN